MPLQRAGGKGKKAVRKAVSANISELTNANKSKPAGKKRKRDQIIAIAISEAKKGKKKSGSGDKRIKGGYY